MGIQDPEHRHRPKAVQCRGAQHRIPQEPRALVKSFGGTCLGSRVIRPLRGERSHPSSEEGVWNARERNVSLHDARFWWYQPEEAVWRSHVAQHRMANHRRDV